MKQKKQEFIVTITTQFGIGIMKVKALSIKDAFLKLGKRDRMKNGFIEDEQGNSVTFNQILGIEETI